MRNKTIWIVLFLFLSSTCFGSVDFDGASDYIISDANVVDFGTNDFSIAFWGKFGTDVTTWRHIFSNKDDFGASHVRIRVDRTGGTLDILVESTSVDSMNSTITVNDNVWRHYVLVRTTGNFPAIVARLYINGVLDNTDQGSVAWNGDLGTDDFFWLGTDGANIGTSELDGIITDFAVWTSQLTAGEVSLLYNSKVKRMPLQIQPSSLVWYMPLDDVAEGTGINGSVFSDMSSNKKDATGVEASGTTGGKAEEILSYHPFAIIVTRDAGVAPSAGQVIMIMSKIINFFKSLIAIIS